MFSKYFNRHLEPQHRTRSGVKPVCDGVLLFLSYALTGPFLWENTRWIKPLAFSLLARCQGQYGSAKNSAFSALLVTV
jgi:hypothetical protein